MPSDFEAQIEWRSPDSLTPYVNNAKQHPQSQIDKIAASIAEFGFTVPVVVDGKGVLIAGHGRLAAAQKLHLDKVPVIVRDDLTKAQVKALRIADNKVAESSWDNEALKLELEALAELDFDMQLTGFDDSDLDQLLERLEVHTSEDSKLVEDEIPEESEIEKRVSRGEIWSIAGHLVMCGDCRKAGDVQNLLGDAPVNVVMTSPPYASQRKYDEESGFLPIAPDEYVKWFELVQSNIKNHLAKDGSFFLNIKEHCEDGQRHLYVKDLTIAHVRLWGWRFVDEFCWLRTSPPGKWNNRFKNGFEPVFHFSLNQRIKLNHEAVGLPSDNAFLSTAGGMAFQKYHNYDMKDDIKKHISEGGRGDGLALPSNVIKASLGEVNLGTLHQPATYPVALPEFFIKAFSDIGDRIYDPFAGSGTTGVAAIKNGRKTLLMELSEKYCDLILTRLERESGATAQLVSATQDPNT